MNTKVTRETADTFREGGKGTRETVGPIIMALNHHPDILSRLNRLSDVEREQKLALYLELEPLIFQCLSLNHDINNPLTGILGYGEILLLDADKLPAETADQLKTIMDCAERIKTIVEELSEVKSAVSEQLNMQALIEQYKSEPTASD